MVCDKILYLSFFSFKNFFNCLYAWTYKHVGVGTYRGQKRLLTILELELKVIVYYPVWVMQTKLRSSRRAASILS